ncbi:MAG: hypothetical protein OXF54_04055, partial [Caldilineaceae bacterium]|nr:hypothetical protein [Caldilineaceae bacterium]
GMLLAGGVAGAEPPHKGGRLRPTAQLQQSVVSEYSGAGSRNGSLGRLLLLSTWVLISDRAVGEGI